MGAVIAFFRAVNVGGRSAKMVEIRTLFADLGFEDARTLLQSGNVVFRAEKADAATEGRIETAFEARFGFAADVMLRTGAEWAEALKANPFPAEAKADPAHLLVAPLKSKPSADVAADFLDRWKGPEKGRVVGREAFLVYPQGVGRSKLTNPVIERALGVRATARNWNTAVKLLEATRP